MCEGCFHQIASIKPFKDKKVKAILNDFIKIVNESNRKPNKLRSRKRIC